MPDLYVTTKSIPRTRVLDLPHGYELVLTPLDGWTLYFAHGCDTRDFDVLGSEIMSVFYGGIRVDLDGVCLCDNLSMTFDEARRELPKLQQPARIHRVNSPIKVVEVSLPPTLDCPEQDHVATAVAALEG